MAMGDLARGDTYDALDPFDIAAARARMRYRPSPYRYPQPAPIRPEILAMPQSTNIETRGTDPTLNLLGWTKDELRTITRAPERLIPGWKDRWVAQQARLPSPEGDLPRELGYFDIVDTRYPEERRR
jgi:hypothetical protein